jgi:HAD superfamily hydrolase (TIGR01509 family)
VIRGIIFDCFGVLYHGSLDQLFERTPPAKYQEMRDLHHSYDYGYIDKGDFFKGAGMLMGVSAVEVERICSKEHVRNDPLVDYIKTLRPRYKTALLSNVGRGFLDNLFTKEELKELFDTEILSSEVHMMKPSAGIYLLAAERLGVQPTQCVMVDDLLRNVDAAKEVGMFGIQYTTVDAFDNSLSALLGGTHA